MHWNVKEAADACGVTVGNWRNWEADKGGRMATVRSAVQAIAGLTGCDYLWLLDGPVRMQATPPAADVQREASAVIPAINPCSSHGTSLKIIRSSLVSGSPTVITGSAGKPLARPARRGARDLPRPTGGTATVARRRIGAGGNPGRVDPNGDAVAPFGGKYAHAL
jgi:hypothetical protein